MALTEESVAEMIKKHITAACQEGGELFTMIAGVKAGRGGDRKDEGIVGMLKKQGNQLQPSRFENEVKSGILFRHWNVRDEELPEVGGRKYAGATEHSRKESRHEV